MALGGIVAAYLRHSDKPRSKGTIPGVRAEPPSRGNEVLRALVLTRFTLVPTEYVVLLLLCSNYAYHYVTSLLFFALRVLC